SDGNLVAYDAANGNVSWTFQTGAGADAPVSTFQVDGQQYVAILSGGNQFQLSARGDRLWAFKLGGTVPPAPARPPPPRTPPAASMRRPRASCRPKRSAGPTANARRDSAIWSVAKSGPNFVDARRSPHSPTT